MTTLITRTAAVGLLCLVGCTNPGTVENHPAQPPATTNTSNSVNLTASPVDAIPEAPERSNREPTIKAHSRRVQYVADTIMEIDETSIQLLGGSRWELLGLSLALPLEDIWIVLTSEKAGIAFIDGSQISVVHRSGLYTTATGLFGKVVAATDDGALLTLDDGSLWSVPHYDRFDTGWWLPPYPAIVTGNGLYLINLKKGKKVWVSQAR